MKTKIVYVLTSTEKDFYLEQALMSVHSCRMHNPDACLVLVTETETRQTCETGLRKKFVGYFDEIKMADVSEFPTMAQRSRALKTMLREIVEGDFLYIDGDTVVCEPLSYIDKAEGLLSCALDMHITQEHWRLFFNKNNIVRAFGTADVDKHFNCGVSFVRDCHDTHAFYKRWHEEWRKALANGNGQDQPPFHTTMAALNFTVEELDGTWNCMLCGNFLPYLYRAKILHTFASANYLDVPSLFRDESLYKEIRENGGLTEHVLRLLASPKDAFSPLNLSIGAGAISLVKSPLVERAGYFRKHYPVFYRLLTSFSSLLRTLCDWINWIRVHF